MRTTTRLQASRLGLACALLVSCAVGAPFATDAPGSESPTTSPFAGSTPSGRPDSSPTEALPSATPESPDATPEPDASETPDPSDTPDPDDDFPRRVPRVTIRTADVSFDLRPWTWCYIPGCLDGFPPDPPPSVGEASSVEVGFPLGDWEFVAEFKEVGPRCPRTQLVNLEKTGDHTWGIEPHGFAGTYDVDVFGGGPTGDGGNGDAVVTFRWTTPHDGPLPVPQADFGLFVLNNDDVIESYGVSMTISDVASTAKSADASVTVTAANGESLSFDLAQPFKGCGNGDLYWNGPDRVAQEAPELGPAPFTYDIVLILDDERYTGHAEWPTEQTEQYDSSAAIEFSPPLPALQPRP